MGSGVSVHRSAECGFKRLRERILEREHALRELAVVQLRVLHAHSHCGTKSGIRGGGGGGAARQP